MTSHVNLVPATVRRRAEHRRQSRRWMFVWAAVVGVLCMGQVALRGAVRRTELQQRSWVAESEPLRVLENDINSSLAQITALRVKLSRQVELEQADAPLALLQLITEACHASGDKITLNSYRMGEEGEAYKSEKSDKQRTPPGKRVMLTGESATDQAVSEFVRYLRSQGAFSSVELKATQATESEGEWVRTFQLECNI